MASVQSLFRSNSDLTAPNGLPILVAMTHSSSVNDPLTQFEDAERNNYTSIDNSGRGVIKCRNPLWEINDLYECGSSGSSTENSLDYGTSDQERRFDLSAMLADEISENLGLQTSQIMSYAALSAEYHYGDAVQAKGHTYTQVLDESGELVYYDLSEGEDGFNMCVLPKSLNLGSTTPLTGMDAMNALSNPDFNINYKVTATGDVVPKTSFEKTMDDVDNQLVGSAALSADTNTIIAKAAGITQPTTAFNKATATAGSADTQQNSVVFREDLTLVEQAALDITRAKSRTDTTSPSTLTNVTAANSPTFLLTGTQGPAV